MTAATPGTKYVSSCSSPLPPKEAEEYIKKVKAEAAANPNCPVQILEKLANNSDQWIRQYVAQNPNCPIELLEKLANDSDEDVREAATKNPNYRREIE